MLEPMAKKSLPRASAMNNPTQTRQELENVWRERVKTAEQEYHRARAEADAALELCGCDAASAQIEALIQKRVRESAALGEFMCLMKVFHDLVLVGKEPGP